MGDPAALLVAEREMERAFVAREAAVQRDPKGWPASLIMFHVGQWRERLLRGLTDFDAGREYTPSPPNVDELNDAELPSGRGLPLAETAARADELLVRMIDISRKVGDQPFKWSVTGTSGDAIVRNSYFHPRLHIGIYLDENGEVKRSYRLFEETASALRGQWPAPFVLGASLYNLAWVRVAQGRHDEAITLLEEAAPMRPDLARAVLADEDFAALREDPRFKAIGGSA